MLLCIRCVLGGRNEAVYDPSPPSLLKTVSFILSLPPFSFKLSLLSFSSLSFLVSIISFFPSASLFGSPFHSSFPLISLFISFCLFSFLLSYSFVLISILLFLFLSHSLIFLISLFISISFHSFSSPPLI